MIQPSTAKQSRIATEIALFKDSFRKNKVMYAFLILPTIYFIVFKYVPMFGNIIAFRKYVPGGSILGQGEFTLRYFKLFLGDPAFWAVFRNTITLSGLVLLFTFPLPIIFALMLNEIENTYFKKTVQTLTIIPKFLSIVVAVMMVNMLLSPSVGIVNHIITYLGGKEIFFMNEASWFHFIYVASELWQFLGWNSIIYMAVLASADKQQYEAAMVDGANRWKQTIHVTLPTMLPTIAINFIIAIGCVLNLSFEKNLLLYKGNIAETADVIQTFVYRMGLLNKNYSYATAVGLFQAVISLSMLFIANKIINKYWDCGLW